MYIYKDKIINNPVYIHFLCGSFYHRKDSRDKRNVLKKYIDSIDNNYAIILEKLFELPEYDELGFKDLEDVELMISNFAKSIIIIQETVSTSAEIALFGSKEKFRNKLLVIFAPKNLTITDSVGNFVRNAYFKNDKVNNYEYPSFQKEHFIDKSKKISYFTFYFFENRITDSLKNVINDFWNKTNNDYDINLKKYFPKISYFNFYKITENNIEISLSYNFIFSLVVCILINNKYIKDKRSINMCISSICFFIKELLIDTICYRETLDKSKYKCKLLMYDGIDINQPIKFLINLFNKMYWINFLYGKLSITDEFKRIFSEYKDLIVNVDEPNFFERGGSNE